MSYMNLLCPLLKILNNRKTLNVGYLLSGVLIFFILSCTFFSGGIKTSYNRNANAGKLIQENGLYINSITVIKSFDSDAVRKNALYAFNVMLGPQTGRFEKGLKTDAVFKEESFVKGFNQLNTVTLELTVKDKNNSIIKIVLITEDSENTLSSYKYLYQIIEKGIKETGI